MSKRPKPLKVLQRPTGPEYNPPVPPRSPVLDEHIFLPYHKTHPKRDATPGNELSPREWALKMNPYAQILASPVRNDADYHHRLPSALLTRFVLKKQPDTDKVWLLPDGLEKDKPPILDVGGYINAMYKFVDDITPGKGRGAKMWLKMIPEKMRRSVLKKGVWRPDMPVFVLEKMRRRFMDEVEKVRLARDVDVIVGGPSEWVKSGETMCVLDFRDRRAWKTPAGEESDELEDEKEEKGVAAVPEEDYTDQDTLRNYSDAGYRIREPPPPMDEKGVIALVAGKRVPVHPMWELLGDEMCADLIRKWRVEQYHPLLALMMSQRTVGLQVWLMRLRYFQMMWFWPEAERDRQY